jgi:hypothetical protein
VYRMVFLAATVVGLLSHVDITGAQEEDAAPTPPTEGGVVAFFSPDQGVQRRYLVTYMKSRVGALSSATAVSVTNLTPDVCHVTVEWFRGFDPNNNPSCITGFSLNADVTADFCSRVLNNELTSCNAVCNPALDFHEGRAIVGASCRRIGVSGRVYYTGTDQIDLRAITDSKIVALSAGSRGD